ncbi:hypothetical protein C8N24_2827 [Solirubrobacter pauli]|uniref:AAA domain-containing protein n=1 Tax=Solirubrobacter pauli TaxID=166793 RepID=A0A660LGC4_9ACTN|nr:hypothetical protein [Solirubrobacter pauli]RKQ92970.1 hypothetical protein C8N24_2827 [Solirubrobacter pauli]
MTRTRTLGDVLPIAAIEPDGLMVTSEATYVRLLECQDVLHPRAGGASHREALRDRLSRLAARLPSGQGLQVIVEAEPVEPDTALERDWNEIRAATSSVDADRRMAMERLGYALEQTLRRSAPAVDAARLRWTIAIRHAPTELRQRIARPSRRNARVLPLRAHERAAAESARLADSLAADLTAAGCRVEALDAQGALTALARCIDPTTAGTDHRPARVLATADPIDALRHRHDTLRSIAGDVELQVRRDWMHRAVGDHHEVEAVLHLAGPPAETSVWWLLALLEVPPPWRLAVHVTATDRVAQRRRYRLRHKRLWADLRRRERDGKLISEEAYEQEREAAEIDAELRTSGASGLYDVSAYQAIRRPADEAEDLAELVRLLGREFESYTDARLYQGRFLVEDSWVSTLPLAADRLGATRRFAQRNVADCLPLWSTSASSEAGVPLGYAVPGNTLERIDLFDPRYRTHVAVVTGASGSGKTVAVNMLLARNVSRGATGYIVDRSSSEDEDGSRRHAGHYEQLVALVPGARIIHYGAGARDAILCPWDTPDVANVPAAKVEFLVALHTLLIGDPSSSGPALAGLERTLLTRGIQTVYARCARSGELPRERLLYEELRRLAREQAADELDGDASVASELRRLAERLHPYIDDGPLAWLADRETTIERGAPLVLFDLAGLPDALAGPVILALVDFIDRDVARRRAQHLAGHSRDTGPWAGRAFVAIDEAWKPLLTPAAGAWLNEWARRTRHLACALLVISQHLADFANAQGRALLRNSVLRLIFHTAHDELAEARDALGLEDEDLEEIAALETRKGEYSTCLLDSEAHGRATVRIFLSDIEYWACSADPERDQPIRELALAESDGDAWRAMRLLCDPAWHQARAEELGEAA